MSTTTYFIVAPDGFISRRNQLMDAILNHEDIHQYVHQMYEQIDGWTALMVAAVNNYAKVSPVETILKEYKENYSNLNIFKRTSYYILNLGVKYIDLQNHEGETALMMAVQSAHRDPHNSAVKNLINAGASLDLKDKHGRTALMWAARGSKKNTEDTVKMLINAGAHVNLQNNIGLSAVMFAAIYGSATSSNNILELLINAGANLELQDSQGKNVLMQTMNGIYCWESSEQTVQIIVNAGVDLFTKPIFSGTPLMCARTKILTQIIVCAINKQFEYMGLNPII